MENTRHQQIAADALVTAAVLALGAVLVLAGKALAGSAAPGGSGDWLRIAPETFDGADAPSIAVLLGLAASLAGLVVVAWWLLSAALAITSALLAAAGAAGAASRTGAFAPAFMRRLAMALLGLTLVTAPAAHSAGLPDPAWHPGASAPHSVPAAQPVKSRSDQERSVDESQPSTQASASGSPTASGLSRAGTSSTDAPLRTGEALLLGEEPSEPGGPPPPVAAPQYSLPPGGVQAAPASGAVPEAAWVPTAPLAASDPLIRQPARAVAGVVAGVVAEPVEVRPGDNLWTIVARHLGPGSTDLDIAAAWPDWYEANAGIIGDTPDLLQPGQLLSPPR
ncbi:hypothetical protein GCM10027449_25970 [Sinomonas notoginsengisoli]|uniref:LysM peptidoglycan-binding domain-containing protein n=1 Tax=Sinomonas notoginsengisoli TaxID=1457311 RepID=UPI001F41A1A5|nr:LysM domain-containing protein [Sinomonas notoginsengisoli]